jgi:hypothetical protein
VSRTQTAQLYAAIFNKFHSFPDTLQKIESLFY